MILTLEKIYTQYILHLPDAGTLAAVIEWDLNEGRQYDLSTQIQQLDGITYIEYANILGPCIYYDVQAEYDTLSLHAEIKEITGKYIEEALKKVP